MQYRGKPLINTRQLRAAFWYLQSLDGKITAREAMRRAGYADATARTPLRFIRANHGMREAINVLSDLLTVRATIPPRYKKYQRRKTAKNIVDYCLPGMNNREVEHYYRGEKHVQHLAAGQQYQSPKVCTCGTRLDDFSWCIQCGRYPFGRRSV